MHFSGREYYSHLTIYTDIEWLDGGLFDYNRLPIGRAAYLKQLDGRQCLVLDVYEPRHYSLVNCSEELRELCYLKDAIGISTGEL